MLTENRKYPRLDFNLPIKLSDSEFDLVTETQNISGNGAYCSVSREIPTMTKLEIILLIPLRKNNKKLLKRINCKGVVIREEPSRNNGKRSHNIGIYFNEIKESDRKTILSYINSVLA